jgi:hypothetical protein
MFENGPSDRMQLVGVGELLHPGSCIVCGNGTCAEGYIRFGVSLEFEGELYLCWFCVVQAAEVLKCLIPSEADTLREIADKVATENASLRKENEFANERLKAVDAIFSPSLADLARISSVFGENSNEESGDDSSTASGSDSEPTGTVTESDESTEGSGPKRSVRLATSDSSSAGIL